MGYSNWRQDLTEVMTDKEDDKKVTEKNIKNKIVINPKLGEAVEALGGELIDLVEVAELEQQEKEKEEDKTLANKQKKISMVKKQVLLKKMQAVRQGAGADIVAHHEPEGNIVSEEEKKDHEYHMARSQLKTIKNAANRLEKKMGKKGEGELKAWVQSKITKASDYIDTAADYVTNEEKKCVHNHKGEECPVHGKKECPAMVEATYPSDFKKGSPVATKKTGRPMQHDQPMSGGRRKTVDESSEDSLRDRRMERGGVDGNTNYRKTPPKFAPGPSKKKYDGMSAVDMVKADIRAKYGKGAIIDKKKK